MSSWGVVVVGGKTSHLFLGGEDCWYQVLVPGPWYQVYLIRDFFFFFSVENLNLYLVPGPWYLVYLTRDIFSAENLILYVRMDLVRIGIGNQPWLYIE